MLRYIHTYIHITICLTLSLATSLKEQYCGAHSTFQQLGRTFHWRIITWLTPQNRSSYHFVTYVPHYPIHVQYMYIHIHRPTHVNWLSTYTYFGDSKRTHHVHIGALLMHAYRHTWLHTYQRCWFNNAHTTCTDQETIMRVYRQWLYNDTQISVLLSFTWVSYQGKSIGLF